MAWITLSTFGADALTQAMLPRAVIEAKHLRNVVDALSDEATGLPGGMSPFLDSGKLKDSSHDILSKAVASLETALRHDLNELPTYIIEKIGIYDTDDLVTKADEALAADLKSHIPPKVMEDFKKAGAGLAFEMHTASGFHGYRAVDSMLRIYCAHFAGVLPQKRDWFNFIDAVRKVPKSNTRQPNLRTLELLDRIRAEDRNPLIHPDIDLDAAQAHLAFNLCLAAISFMAMDIKNAP